MIAKTQESKSRSDAVLHPVRIRIVLAVQGRRMSAGEIHRNLRDVPVPTLYRHLKRLTEAGILEIVGTHQVGSNFEAVYAVKEGSANLNESDVSVASIADHSRYFTIFLTGMLGVYERYLKSTPNVARDKVMYYSESACLGDEQYRLLCQEMRALITKAQLAESSPGARRRNLAVIAFPDPAQDD